MAELVAVEAEAKPGRTARLEDRTRLVCVERTRFTKGIHPFGVRLCRVEHLVADQVDVVVGAACELCGQEVGSEERRLGGVPPGDLDAPGFVNHVEAVSRLDLDRGGPGTVCLGQSLANQAVESISRHGSSGVGGDTNSSAVIRLTSHTCGELFGTVTGENQMGVRVDEPGQRARTVGVDPVVGKCASGPDVFDHPVDDHDRCVVDDAERTSAERRVVGDQRPNVVDRERSLCRCQSRSHCFRHRPSAP